MGYFRYALQSGIPLYVSTLVAMEFSRKQPIESIGLHQVTILPFNLPEAVLAAALAESSPRREGDDRVAVTTDLALIAQAEKHHIPVILTEDASTLRSYCDRLREAGMVHCHAVLLAEGFDPARMTDPSAPGLPLKPP